MQMPSKALPVLIAIMAVALVAIALFIWLIFFTTPFTFRSDCEQTGPNSWVCDNPL
jgi:hypothetical protein